jgi:hypothetical protein
MNKTHNATTNSALGLIFAAAVAGLPFGLDFPNKPCPRFKDGRQKALPGDRPTREDTIARVRQKNERSTARIAVRDQRANARATAWLGRREQRQAASAIAFDDHAIRQLHTA